MAQSQSRGKKAHLPVFDLRCLILFYLIASFVGWIFFPNDPFIKAFSHLSALIDEWKSGGLLLSRGRLFLALKAVVLRWQRSTVMWGKGAGVKMRQTDVPI